MKILALNPSGLVGGAEISLLDVLAGLVGHGHSVLLAAPGNGALLLRAAQREIPVCEWKMPEQFRRSGRYSSRKSFAAAAIAALRTASTFIDIALCYKADLVYSNGMKSHLLTGMICPLIQMPVVWHVRDFVTNRRFSKLLFSLARWANVRIIANSHAVAKEWHAQQVRATVVHNGLDPSEAALIDRRRPGVDRVRLLAAGILAPWKGFNVILNACANLRSTLNWSLTICGDELYETDGHYGEKMRLQRLARDLGIAERVLFTGMVDDLGVYFRESDIFVHGSVSPEPFGRVVAEAMLAGMPVIASSGGGIPEFVRDGTDGMLYEMGSVEDLRIAIDRLAADPAGRAMMGSSARNRILADFALSDKIDAIERELMKSVALTPATTSEDYSTYA